MSRSNFVENRAKPVLHKNSKMSKMTKCWNRVGKLRTCGNPWRTIITSPSFDWGSKTEFKVSSFVGPVVLLINSRTGWQDCRWNRHSRGYHKSTGYKRRTWKIEVENCECPTSWVIRPFETWCDSNYKIYAVYESKHSPELSFLHFPQTNMFKKEHSSITQRAIGVLQPIVDSYDPVGRIQTSLVSF